MQLERCESLLEEIAPRKKSGIQTLRTVPGWDYCKSYQAFLLVEIDNTDRRTNTQLTLVF